MHETVSNRLVLLVDGRSANNPIFGGPEFHRLSIFPEDIERIEVVRGPGGAAWGANAFNGAVNIISKDPSETLGFFGSTAFTEFGDSFTHLRWGAQRGEWTWRVSSGYEDLETSGDAGAGRYISTASIVNFIVPRFVDHDFSRNWRVDSQAVYQPSRSTRLSMGMGYSHILSGDYEIAGYNWGDRNNRSELLNLFAKIEHDFDDGATGYIQWFASQSRMNWVNLANYEVLENDIEAQLNLAPLGNHHITFGGNFRWDDIQIRSDSLGYYSFPGTPYYERWAGLFAIDRWDVTDRLTLEGQVRGDTYSEVTTDWSNRFTALYDVDGKDNHTLRLSVAKAFRAPLASLRQLESHTIPVGEFPPGNILYAIHVAPNEKLKNEQTWAVEAGYSGRYGDNVTLQVNTFYQRLSDLIGYRSEDHPAAGVIYTPDNIDGGDLYGGEIELTYKDKRKSLSAWYAYNELHLDQIDQQIRAYEPARHKCGLTGRVFLDGGWTFNVNYKYMDTTNRTSFVPSEYASLNVCHRLDLTLSKTIAEGRGELMFGVSDLLNNTTQAAAETITVTGHETPGQTFFARLQYRF
jgi:iron complex outermembrane receptor protein